MGLVAALGLLLAGPAGASGSKAKKATPQERTFVGDIASVDAPAKVFTVKSTEPGKPGEMTFHVAHPTSITIDDVLTPVAALRKGDHVTVTYDSSGGAPVAKHLRRHQMPAS
jgi:hypothetical protein